MRRNRKWTKSTTDVQKVNDAKPVVQSIEALRRELMTQPWPTKAKRDIRSLYDGLEPLKATLLELASLPQGLSATPDDWGNKLVSEGTKIGNDDDAVRSVLGNPLIG
jgi:hypothetical protein